MNVKPKVSKLKAQKAARAEALKNNSVEYKPLWLNPEEVEFLTWLVTKFSEDHYMLVKLAKVRQELDDKEQQLRELVARLKATAHWEEPEGSVRNRLEAEQRAHAAKRDKAEAQVAAVSAKEMKRLLKAQAKQQAKDAKAAGKASAAPEQPQPETGFVQQPDEGGVAHAQELGGPGATVTGHEGQQLEVGDGDGSLNRSADVPVTADGGTGLVLPPPSCDEVGSLLAGTDGADHGIGLDAGSVPVPPALHGPEDGPVDG